ncbi:hypothetical protein JM49_29690 [Pseudomonas chlororaphis subsp. aurantiaca]|nr:hypothetical protein JM49_29690 [Pseudomonas chlororaphis subsp. aurantiaca]
MTTGTDNLRQFKIVKTLHHGFKHVGRDHIAHDPVVIEHRNRTTLCAVQDSRRIFFQFRHADSFISQYALHN